MEGLRDGFSDCQRMAILGIDSTLGANLALALSDRFAVLGLYGRHAVALEGCWTASWNPADLPAVRRMILDHRPHWIVLCGPFCASSWDSPAESPSADDARRTARRLALLAAEAGSRLTILSTDAVFAGPRMFHAETDPALEPRPCAQAALGVEQAVQDSDALVVRTHAFGWSPAGVKSGFAERLWQGVREGASSPASPHSYATPILATDLAELLWLAYRRRLAGLYHIAGAERTSQRRFATEMAAAFGLAQPPSPSPENPFDSSEVRETSLDTRRARRGLQRGMPMLREGLERFAQQAVNGFRARLQSPARRPAREAA